MLSTLFVLLFLIFAFVFLHQLKLKKKSLSLQILTSLALGILVGFLLQFSNNYLRETLSFIGNGYLALLKMLVIPLILTSLIHAILNVGREDSQSIKKLSLQSVSLLLGMTAIASLVGMLVGIFFHVGQGLTLPHFETASPHVYNGIVSTLLGMIPSNPVASMTKDNTIAVVIFAVLIGIAARCLDSADHDKMETFREWVAAIFAIVKKLTTLILSLTPYGILALISLLIFDEGTMILSGMLNFIMAMYVAMLIVIAMHTLILLFLGQNPWDYFKKACNALLVAFTTRSSFGTLPVTEETLRNKFQTSQVVATFVPSLGATIGMNACAGIFPAMLVVMTLTILHEPITFSLILMVMFINAIASLGISGIPGTAYIAATVTLTSLNLPYAVIALVQGIDPIIDMGRTATNVNGVMTTALVANRFDKS